jgi:hypothetical protein
MLFAFPLFAGGLACTALCFMATDLTAKVLMKVIDDTKVAKNYCNGNTTFVVKLFRWSFLPSKILF